MSIVLLVARLALTAVFAASGIAKLADLSGTRRAIAGFGFRERAARVGAWVLPLGEIAVAMLLLATSTAWWGSLGALALLVAFCTAIGVNLYRGRAPDCHCFGQLHSEPVSSKTLVRNAVLALPAVLVLIVGWTNPGPSAVAWLGDLRLAEAILSVVCVVLAAALVGVVTFLRRLLVRQRELAESVSVMERLFDARDEGRFTRLAAAAQMPRGLPVGAAAPDARLATSDGDHVTLGDLIANHPAVALVFVSAGCAPCRELLPKLVGWQREWSARLRLIVIVPGSREMNAKLVADYPNLGLLLADDMPVAAEYRAQWTPAAVVVSNQGRIASETKFGGAEIDALLVAAAGDHPRLAPLGSKIGAPAPAFAAVDDRGIAVTNEVFAGRATALVYWDPTCRYCGALVNEFLDWAEEPPTRVPRLMLITQRTEPLPDRFGAETVLVDPGGDVVRAFGFTGTPSAVLIEADGTIASSMCLGGDDVKSLLGIVRRPRDRAASELPIRAAADRSVG